MDETKSPAAGGRPEIFGERTGAIPKGAEVKPWWFFVDGDLSFEQCKGWQVWLGGDHWMDIQWLIYSRTHEGNYPHLASAPNGLMLIVRYVDDE